MNNPLVSVIVTTKNEEKNIKNFCESVKKQSYQYIELLVVDNNSEDKTKKISLEYTKNVYNVGPERSVQRNYGVQKAKGTYILVLDADMMLTKDVVLECVDVIAKHPEIKAITIPEKSIGTSFWAKCKSLERHFYYLDTVDNGIEAARFFDKNVFEEVGGYDSNISGGEDWDVPERIYLKYPKKFKIKSHIIHNEGNVSLIKLMQKKFYYIGTATLYMKKNKIPTFGPKTIYFLRPVFYKFWKEWFKDIPLSLGTVFMLFCEFLAGAFGYLLTITKLQK